LDKKEEGEKIIGQHLGGIKISYCKLAPKAFGWRPRNLRRRSSGAPNGGSTKVPRETRSCATKAVQFSALQFTVQFTVQLRVQSLEVGQKEAAPQTVSNDDWRAPEKQSSRGEILFY